MAWNAIDHPSHLDRTYKDEVTVPPPEQDKEIVGAEAKHKTTTDGLAAYNLKSAGLKKVPPFVHMCGKRQRDYADREADHNISDYLGLVSPVKEYIPHQKDFFKVDYMHVLQSEVIGREGRSGSERLAATKSKLDNLGTVKNHAFMCNNPDIMDKLRESYTLEASVAEILTRKEKYKEADTTKLSNMMQSKLRRGLILYMSGNHGRTLTMIMIHLILHFPFGAPCKTKQGAWAD